MTVFEKFMELARSGKFQKAKGLLRKDKNCYCLEGLMCEAYRRVTKQGRWVRRLSDMDELVWHFELVDEFIGPRSLYGVAPYIVRKEFPGTSRVFAYNDSSPDSLAEDAEYVREQVESYRKLFP